MASKASGSSVTKTMIQLHYAGKKLSLLPSSTADLLHLLKQLEEILSKVQQSPSESINDALNTIIEGIFAKELVRHSDVNVNISVACCICEIMRIMAPKNPYYDELMKDLFEMVVITFEKLSSGNGGCYAKMTKVLKTFNSNRLWVMMLDLKLDGHGLIVRLFKQFLTIASSKSAAIVFEMEKIMTMIIDENEELAPELLSLIVTTMKSDYRIASHVCWQLGEKVLMNYAAHRIPNLPEMGQDMSIALYDYSKMVARICDTALENEITVGKGTIPCTTHKIKIKRRETLKSCQDAIRHTVLGLRSKEIRHTVLGLRSKDNERHEKKSHIFSGDPPKSSTELKRKRKRNNSPWKKQEAKETIPYTTHKIKVKCRETLKSRQDAIRHIVLGLRSKDNVKHENISHTLSGDPPKSLTKLKEKRKRSSSPWRKQDQFVEHGENLVGSRIKVWWPADRMYYSGVVMFFDFKKKRHKVLYDDGDEELLNLKLQRWKLLQYASAVPGSVGHTLPDTVCVHGYTVKQSVAPVLEAIINKHGDIAAKCVFKVDSIKSSLLEHVCDIVKQLEPETNGVIGKMEEIENQVSTVEKANINVSWLRAHLEAINKTNGDKTVRLAGWVY